MASAWFKSLMATPPILYGHRLRPFSLAHSLTLREIKSPFILGGEVTLYDVYKFAEICRRTRREIQRDLFKILSKRRWISWTLRWYRIRKHTPIAIENIKQYVEDFSDRPVHSRTDTPEEGTRILNSPKEFVMHANLCELGYDPETAWDESLSMAFCLYDVREERNGDTTLLAQWQVENDAMMAEANRLAEAGMKDQADELYAKCEQDIKEHQ